MEDHPAHEADLKDDEKFEDRPDVSLHSAAGHSDSGEVSRLLDAGGDVNARDYSECTPLHHAIHANSARVVRLLLTRGANPDLRNLGGSDGLEGDDAALCAARLNAIAAMRELVLHGVLIHSHTLAFAASGGHMDMIKLLLEEHTRDFSDMPKQQAVQTTLPSAANTWNIEMVQYLLDKLEFRRGLTGKEGQHVLDRALLGIFDQDEVHDSLIDPAPGRNWDSALQILKSLIDAGAHINAHKMSSHALPYNLLCKRKPYRQN